MGCDYHQLAKYKRPCKSLESPWWISVTKEGVWSVRSRREKPEGQVWWFCDYHVWQLVDHHNREHRPRLSRSHIAGLHPAPVSGCPNCYPPGPKGDYSPNGKHQTHQN